MEVHEKRMLLEAVEVLVKRPALADESTLGIAIGYFAKLVAEATGEQITIVPVEIKGVKS